ncbi:hypothetical protein Tco_0529257 [Tanacetum coccineum]
MTREEDDGISITFISGFCIASEWEVVYLGGTTLVEVILVKGHELPTIVKILPVGRQLLELRLGRATHWPRNVRNPRKKDSSNYERLLTARSRQKSYADLKRRLTEFEVGDKVMLKVSPWKGVIRFGKRGKLSPRFVGPFKRCFVNDDVVFVGRSSARQQIAFYRGTERLWAREVDETGLQAESDSSLLSSVGNSRRGPEFTWEREDFFRSKYPHLFARRRVTRQDKRRDVAS